MSKSQEEKLMGTSSLTRIFEKRAYFSISHSFQTQNVENKYTDTLNLESFLLKVSIQLREKDQATCRTE